MDRRGAGEGVQNAKTGNEDDGGGNPEASIRGERGSRNNVASLKLPHACQNLDNATVKEANSYKNVDAS